VYAAAAVAAAAVVAVEAPYSERYWRIRQAVYPVVRKKVDEILAPTQLLPSALELLDRMLPPEPEPDDADVEPESDAEREY